jgi:uncharacterized protein YjbJ (UPF0337 family)
MKYVLTIKGDWKELKGRLKKKYTNLTDDDLEYKDGKYEEMMDDLRFKLSKTRQEFIQILNHL